MQWIFAIFVADPQHNEMVQSWGEGASNDVGSSGEQLRKGFWGV